MAFLDFVETDIGTMTLERRFVQGLSDAVYEIFLDDDVLMSSMNPISERQLSSSALSQHSGGALQVLVGGLGLGHTAQAALQDPRVERVRVVEKMDFIIGWMTQGALPLSNVFAGDERVEVDLGDVYQELLAAPKATYDLILIDVDHAPDAPLSDNSAGFYSAEGQQRVAEHLNPGGILGVWSAVPNSKFSQVLSDVYPASHYENVSWQDFEYPEADFQNTLFYAHKLG